MKARGLSYEELIEYARQHYNKGGDGIYECWDQNTYNEYVSMFGPITKRKSLRMFKDFYTERKEIESTIW